MLPGQRFWLSHLLRALARHFLFIYNRLFECTSQTLTLNFSCSLFTLRFPSVLTSNHVVDGAHLLQHLLDEAHLCAGL